MEVSIKSQLLAILYAVIFGLFLGVFYDFVRSARILIVGSYDFKNKSKFLNKKLSKLKTKETSVRSEKIVIFITDILYFILISPFAAIFMYATSSGIVRWYLFLGFGIGIIIYFFTLRRLIKPVYEAIIILIRLAFEYVKRPLKRILNMLKDALKKQRKKKKSKTKKKEKSKDSKQVILYIGKEKSPDTK